MRAGRLLIGVTVLSAIAGCAPGSGPGFIRLVNDTHGPVQVREITQSNSPSCHQPGYVPPDARILLTPSGECVVTAGVLDPGGLVALSLGEPKTTSEAPPIVVVNGYGAQRCMVLPLPLLYSYGTRFDVSSIQPGGCDG